MHHLSRRSLSVTLLALFFSSSSLAFAEWQMDLSPGVTSISEQVFDMHRQMLYWCTGIGALVFGAMFYSMFAHRKSRGVKAAHFHESTTVEIIWTIIPFIILIIMAIPATRLLINMHDTSSPQVTIKVTGSRWKWHYEYMDYKGDDQIKLGFFSVLSTPLSQIHRPVLASGLFPKGVGKDEYREAGDYEAQGENYNLEVDNPMVVPVGAKVRLLLTSDDVIHAWWVPNFAIKKDAIPGFINELWFNVPADKPGVYRGQCAELCGKDHAFMPVVVEAKPVAEFEQWLAQRQEDQRKAEIAASQSLDKTFTKEELLAEGEKEYVARCSACHQANGQGLPPTFPALAGSAIAQGPVADHINTVKFGKNAMPPFGTALSPKVIASIITYERNAWGNKPTDGVELVQPRDVAQ